MSRVLALSVSYGIPFALLSAAFFALYLKKGWLTWAAILKVTMTWGGKWPALKSAMDGRPWLVKTIAISWSVSPVIALFAMLIAWAASLSRFSAATVAVFCSTTVVLCCGFGVAIQKHFNNPLAARVLLVPFAVPAGYLIVVSFMLDPFSFAGSATTFFSASFACLFVWGVATNDVITPEEIASSYPSHVQNVVEMAPATNTPDISASAAASVQPSSGDPRSMVNNPSFAFFGRAESRLLLCFDFIILILFGVVASIRLQNFKGEVWIEVFTIMFIDGLVIACATGFLPAFNPKLLAFTAAACRASFAAFGIQNWLVALSFTGFCVSVFLSFMLVNCWIPVTKEAAAIRTLVSVHKLLSMRMKPSKDVSSAEQPEPEGTATVSSGQNNAHVDSAVSTEVESDSNSVTEQINERNHAVTAVYAFELLWILVMTLLAQADAVKTAQLKVRDETKSHPQYLVGWSSLILQIAVLFTVSVDRLWRYQQLHSNFPKAIPVFVSALLWGSATGAGALLSVATDSTFVFACTLFAPPALISVVYLFRIDKATRGMMFVAFLQKGTDGEPSTTLLRDRPEGTPALWGIFRKEFKYLEDFWTTCSLVAFLLSCFASSLFLGLQYMRLTAAIVLELVYIILLAHIGFLWLSNSGMLTYNQVLMNCLVHLTWSASGICAVVLVSLSIGGAAAVPAILGLVLMPAVTVAAVTKFLGTKDRRFGLEGNGNAKFTAFMIAPFVVAAAFGLTLGFVSWGASLALLTSLSIVVWICIGLIQWKKEGQCVPSRLVTKMAALSIIPILLSIGLGFTLRDGAAGVGAGIGAIASTSTLFGAAMFLGQTNKVTIGGRNGFPWLGLPVDMVNSSLQEMKLAMLLFVSGVWTAVLLGAVMFVSFKPGAGASMICAALSLYAVGVSMSRLRVIFPLARLRNLAGPNLIKSCWVRAVNSEITSPILGQLSVLQSASLEDSEMMEAGIGGMGHSGVDPMKDMEKLGQYVDAMQIQADSTPLVVDITNPNLFESHMQACDELLEANVQLDRVISHFLCLVLAGLKFSLKAADRDVIPRPDASVAEVDPSPIPAPTQPSADSIHSPTVVPVPASVGADSIESIDSGPVSPTVIVHPSHPDPAIPTPPQLVPSVNVLPSQPSATSDSLPGDPGGSHIQPVVSPSFVNPVHEADPQDVDLSIAARVLGIRKISAEPVTKEQLDLLVQRMASEIQLSVARRKKSAEKRREDYKRSKRIIMPCESIIDLRRNPATIQTLPGQLQALRDNRFKDSDFEPYNARGIPLENWKRASELLESADYKLFGESNYPLPEDIQQGELGDCWLLSATSVVAKERPETMRDIFISGNVDASEHKGIFCVRIRAQGGDYAIFIDDQLPGRTYGGLVFARSVSNNVGWISLLEKAYAKLFGSFEALNGGMAHVGMSDLAGGTPAFLNLQPEDPDVVSGAVWNSLLRWKSFGWLLAAGSNSGDDSDTSDTGIVQGHAYAVLDIRQIGQFKLLQLRNPWATQEWLGDWSDESVMWKKFPNVAYELKHESKDDGAFWIQFEDFIHEFDQLSLSRIFDHDFWSSKRFLLAKPSSHPQPSECGRYQYAGDTPQFWLFVHHKVEISFAIRHFAPARLNNQGQPVGRLFKDSIRVHMVPGQQGCRVKGFASHRVLTSGYKAFASDSLVLEPRADPYVIIISYDNEADLDQVFEAELEVAGPKGQSPTFEVMEAPADAPAVKVDRIR